MQCMESLFLDTLFRLCEGELKDGLRFPDFPWALKPFFNGSTTAVPPARSWSSSALPSHLVFPFLGSILNLHGEPWGLTDCSDTPSPRGLAGGFWEGESQQQQSPVSGSISVHPSEELDNAPSLDFCPASQSLGYPLKSFRIHPSTLLVFKTLRLAMLSKRFDTAEQFEVRDFLLHWESLICLVCFDCAIRGFLVFFLCRTPASFKYPA